jgi:hypothetical protein
METVTLKRWLTLRLPKPCRLLYRCTRIRVALQEQADVCKTQYRTGNLLEANLVVRCDNDNVSERDIKRRHKVQWVARLFCERVMQESKTAALMPQSS